MEAKWFSKLLYSCIKKGKLQKANQELVFSCFEMQLALKLEDVTRHQPKVHAISLAFQRQMSKVLIDVSQAFKYYLVIFLMKKVIIHFFTQNSSQVFWQGQICFLIFSRCVFSYYSLTLLLDLNCQTSLQETCMHFLCIYT